MRMNMLVTAMAAALLILTSVSSAHAKTVILVSAAASLSDALRDIGAEFMAESPDVKVEFNFAASGALLRQMELGAPVDVFASADMRTMDLASGGGLVDKETVAVFASNALVIVTPAGTRSGVKGPDGLLSAKVARVAIGNPATVPAGAYAKESLMAQGVWDGLGSKLVLAEHVRQVLDYVRRGEVDAGIVYATDAACAKGGVSVAARLSTAAPVLYPAAVARSSRNRVAAKRFVGYLKSERAAAIFRNRGFGVPER